MVHVWFIPMRIMAKNASGFLWFIPLANVDSRYNNHISHVILGLVLQAAWKIVDIYHFSCSWLASFKGGLGADHEEPEPEVVYPLIGTRTWFHLVFLLGLAKSERKLLHSLKLTVCP